MATIAQSAERFAKALDVEDYAAARAALAANCVYDSPEGPLVGPPAIVASYQMHAASARARFDQVEYQSQVEVTGHAEALVTYIDRVIRGGAWHEFRCRQRLRLDANGLIEQIRHEEIAGERERLQQFEARAGGEGRS